MALEKQYPMMILMASGLTMSSKTLIRLTVPCSKHVRGGGFRKFEKRTPHRLFDILFCGRTALEFNPFRRLATSRSY